MVAIGIRAAHEIEPPIMIYLLLFCAVSPSLFWISFDESVWMWDQAVYRKAAIELFYTLVYSPSTWQSRMVNVLNVQAPGLSWLGQLFVPLGYWLGSFDAGLLLSIVAIQLLTLVLMYHAVLELSGGAKLVAFAGSLSMGSASLFVALSHQYLTEPLQLFVVTWFLLIMTFAPKWSRADILSQLLAAISLAMLSKVIAPLYCVGPALVTFGYIAKPRAADAVEQEWLRARVLTMFAIAVLLGSAAICWYYGNINYVVRHISVSSWGPIAEIYGRKDSFFNTLLYWFGAVYASFFAPPVFYLVILAALIAAMNWCVTPRKNLRQFTICGSVAIFQVLAVLTVFSFNSNRDVRFLLPVLPFLVLIICWSLAQIESRIVNYTAIVLFLVQLASTYGQAFGIMPRLSTSPWWLLPPNSISDQSERHALKAIIFRTCEQKASGPYWNFIGVETPWLNAHSANYMAAKSLGIHNRLGCYFTSFGYEADPDKVFAYISSTKIHYYVTVDPKSNPIPSEDAHLRAINRLYLALLEKVQSSGSFDLERPLRADPSVLIYRRRGIGL